MYLQLAIVILEEVVVLLACQFTLSSHSSSLIHEALLVSLSRQLRNLKVYS